MFNFCLANKASNVIGFRVFKAYYLNLEMNECIIKVKFLCYK